MDEVFRVLAEMAGAADISTLQSSPAVRLLKQTNGLGIREDPTLGLFDLVETERRQLSALQPSHFSCAY